MHEHEPLDPNKPQPEPIPWESLSSELLKKNGAIYDSIGQHPGTTLGPFKTRIMRDMNPESGVVI